MLAVEGRVTEPQYFSMFQARQATIRLEVLKDTKTSALQILERMKEYIKNNPLQDGDQAWLVLDKDNSLDTDLDLLHAWTQGGNDGQRGMALSNPCFEYWLLLHFEDGSGAGTKETCNNRLKSHLPDYSKHINKQKFTGNRIAQAIERAKKRDQPPCPDWPRQPGSTTVYKLVEKLLDPGSIS